MSQGLLGNRDVPNRGHLHNQRLNPEAVPSPGGLTSSSGLFYRDVQEVEKDSQ